MPVVGFDLLHERQFGTECPLRATVPLSRSEEKNRGTTLVELHRDLKAALRVEQDDAQELLRVIVREVVEAVVVQVLSAEPLCSSDELVVALWELVAQETRQPLGDLHMPVVDDLLVHLLGFLQEGLVVALLAVPRQDPDHCPRCMRHRWLQPFGHVLSNLLVYFSVNCHHRQISRVDRGHDVDEGVKNIIRFDTLRRWFGACH